MSRWRFDLKFKKDQEKLMAELKNDPLKTLKNIIKSLQEIMDENFNSCQESVFDTLDSIYAYLSYLKRLLLN